MKRAEIVEEIDPYRRRLLGAAAVAATAAQLGAISSASAQQAEGNMPVTSPGTNASFAPLKRMDAGALNVAYAEAGPDNAPAVILLHGWPYDIYSFVEVAPLLTAAGYRVIIPYLRGYGGTRFLVERHAAQRPTCGACG